VVLASTSAQLLTFEQVGGSLAKVVYFTRSPEEPSSPFSNSTPSPQDSISSSPSSSAIRHNGALTPLVLDSSSYEDAGRITNGLIRDSMLRRTVQHVPGGSLNFERFETDNIHECVDFIQELIQRSAKINGVSLQEMRKGVKIMATGGGAHKFYELFSGQLCVEVRREDEMECLIEGLKFFTLIPNEVYYFSDELLESTRGGPSHGNGIMPPSDGRTELERPSPDPPKFSVSFEGTLTPQLPCLLVNIGSGVSIIKVDEAGKFERVSGTSLGGGTLWGLLSLLTPATSFDGPFTRTTILDRLSDAFLQRCCGYLIQETMPQSTCLWEISTAKTTADWDSSRR